MTTRLDTPGAFRDWAARQSPAAPVFPRAVMLVRPVGFRLSGETSTDNRYMDTAKQVDPERALAQHRALADALATELPVRQFDGAPASPDAVFPNNVFATTADTLLTGAMRHPERRLEAGRQDIVDALVAEFGYRLARLDAASCVCELTGSSVIDRGRGLALHGRTERLDAAGAAAFDAAFATPASFVFDLAAGEYHSNVVLAVLASRVLLAQRDAFVDPEAVDAIASLYGDHAILLSAEEKAGFVANAISLRPGTVWMSATAERALAQPTRARLRRAGLELRTVAIDEIEKAGGSLRCCVAELF